MGYYQGQANHQTQYKLDESPITAADRASHEYITQALQNLTPHYPVLSEESANTIDHRTRITWHTYWLVDPLDGTKEFIHQKDEFTVNIALIQQHRPILGVIYAPALNQLYYASDQGAFLEDRHSLTPLKIKPYKPERPYQVAGSLRHGREALEKFLHQLGAHQLRAFGSALKFCKIAQGEVDVYPRLTPTMEWDTAAGQCIVEAAGGALIDCSGQTLQYNQSPSLKVPAFLAYGDETLSALGGIFLNCYNQVETVD